MGGSGENISQTHRRPPVLLGGIVLVSTVALGFAAFGLNTVTNPPAPVTTSAPVATCSSPPAGHPATHPPRSFTEAPPQTLDAAKGYVALICTNKGLITIRLRPADAPLTVNNFVFLANHGFYDGLLFHRFVPDFVIQGGDPKGTGEGGPGYKFSDEPVHGAYTAGAVAMANSGVDTNGSQFFIVVGDKVSLEPKYNLFGFVSAGLDVARSLVKGDQMVWVAIQVTEPVSTDAPTPSPTPTPAVSPS